MFTKDIATLALVLLVSAPASATQLGMDWAAIMAWGACQKPC